MCMLHRRTMLPMPFLHNMTVENTAVDRAALHTMIDTGLSPSDISKWLLDKGLDAESVNKVINDLPSYKN